MTPPCVSWLRAAGTQHTHPSSANRGPANFRMAVSHKTRCPGPSTMRTGRAAEQDSSSEHRPLSWVELRERASGNKPVAGANGARRKAGVLGPAVHVVSFHVISHTALQ